MLGTSRKSAQPPTPAAGQVMTYTVTLRNLGPDVNGVHMTDTLPAEVQYAGGLSASAGSWGETGGIITWTGTVSAFVPVQIKYAVAVDAGITDPQVIRNMAQVDDGLGYVYALQSTAIANGHAVYLPLVTKKSP